MEDLNNWVSFELFLLVGEEVDLLLCEAVEGGGAVLILLDHLCQSPAGVLAANIAFASTKKPKS
ncbi:steroid-binding protein 3 [Pyrus ussuriensis x Pyrus communis]|uniref:Steroid-binding protein 3 n=1 Tax=Pyrus ussuriensis x Pyrus communis TaxID=2448454 RepID=A0A5N5G6Y0_9ROSA|nr:steroid-binding protein 3 [Pyrus ussuriensis x Pyrus communis]